MKILVTGGCGFIGSTFIRMALNEHPDVEIVNLDAMTYAANPLNLQDVESNSKYTFIHGDIRSGSDVDKAIDGCDYVVNFAAESHVDRSFDSPGIFEQTNTGGTVNLLKAALKHRIKRFLQISTDEVYGALRPDDPPFTENSELKPSSPYSASKAAADLFALSFHHSFGLDLCITRCSNNYGPRQTPEKLIPFFIMRLIEDRSLPIYGDGRQIRDWIYVDDHCRGIWLALTRGQSGRIYNLSAGCEKTNLEIADLILRSFSKGPENIEHVHDRPGHDRRYAMDFSRAKNELGFTPKTNFEKGIGGTIVWYREHCLWMEEARKRLDNFGLASAQSFS